MEVYTKTSPKDRVEKKVKDIYTDIAERLTAIVGAKVVGKAKAAQQQEQLAFTIGGRKPFVSATDSVQQQQRGPGQSYSNAVRAYDQTSRSSTSGAPRRPSFAGQAGTEIPGDCVRGFCIDFYRAKSNCRRQESCRYSHIACASWVNRGTCEYKGKSCPGAHPDHMKPERYKVVFEQEVTNFVIGTSDSTSFGRRSISEETRQGVFDDSILKTKHVSIQKLEQRQDKETKLTKKEQFLVVEEKITKEQNTGHLTEDYMQLQKLFTVADRVKKRRGGKRKSEPVVTAVLYLGGIKVTAIIDTGATRSYCGTDIAKLLLEENKCKVLPEENIAVTTAKGNDSPKMFKILEVPIRMENSEIVIEENIAIMETLPTDCILLGMTFFNAAGGFIRSTTREITFENYPTTHGVVTMPFDSVLEKDTINLVATESISIAPLRTFSKEKDAIYKVWIHAVDSPSLGASTVTGHVRQDTIVAKNSGLFTLPEKCTLERGIGQVELINLSTDYVHIRKGQNIAEWKKVDKCENASKELKEAAEVMNMANLTMLIKLQDGTILGGKEQEEQEEMKMSDVEKKKDILIGGDNAEQIKILRDMIVETKICEN